MHNTFATASDFHRAKTMGNLESFINRPINEEAEKLESAIEHYGEVITSGLKKISKQLDKLIK